MKEDIMRWRKLLSNLYLHHARSHFTQTIKSTSNGGGNLLQRLQFHAHIFGFGYFLLSVASLATWRSQLVSDQYYFEEWWILQFIMLLYRFSGWVWTRTRKNSSFIIRSIKWLNHKLLKYWTSWSEECVAREERIVALISV